MNGEEERQIGVTMIGKRNQTKDLVGLGDEAACTNT